MLGESGFWHPEAMKNASHAARLLFAILIAVNGVLMAQADIKSDRVLAAIISHTPAPHLVIEGQQLQVAEKAAAQLSNAQAFWGIGRSMEPLYATNTAVIVQEIRYDDIKKGMTVVYLKSTGVRVAHSVVGETRGGFLVQGVNNDEEDAELVTEENFIGVIVQAYASADTAFRTETEKRLAARGKIRTGSRT